MIKVNNWLGQLGGGWKLFWSERENGQTLTFDGESV
jgi:hypothetical protein